MLATKDWITLLGILATLGIGIWNLNISKGNRYINNINSERLKWINNIREAFSNFNKSAYIYANLLGRVQKDDTLEATNEENYTFPEAVYYADLIKLYTNPKEILSVKLSSAMSDLLILLTKTGDFRMSSYKDISDDIHYYQQVILKAEWSRMKKEAKAGKELNPLVITEIFMTTALEIDRNRYSVLLKEEFENQNSNEIRVL
ncbi:hypothetical protein ABEZ76_07570 [Priestia megaterium]